MTIKGNNKENIDWFDSIDTCDMKFLNRELINIHRSIGVRPNILESTKNEKNNENKENVDWLNSNTCGINKCHLINIYKPIGVGPSDDNQYRNIRSPWSQSSIEPNYSRTKESKL